MEGRKGEGVYDVNEDQRNMTQVEGQSYQVHILFYLKTLHPNNYHRACFT